VQADQAAGQEELVGVRPAVAVVKQRRGARQRGLVRARAALALSRAHRIQTVREVCRARDLAARHAEQCRQQNQSLCHLVFFGFENRDFVGIVIWLEVFFFFVAGKKSQAFFSQGFRELFPFFSFPDSFSSESLKYFYYGFRYLCLEN
jgi:hypothetical protein